MTAIVRIDCTECAGHGYVPTARLTTESCPRCGGTGKVARKRLMVGRVRAVKPGNRIKLAMTLRVRS